MIIATGVEPGRRGAGSFVLRLINEAREDTGIGVTFYHRYSKRRLASLLKTKRPVLAIKEYYWRLQKRSALFFLPLDKDKMGSVEPALIIHFQTLGLKWLRNFIENYRGTVWIYLMDSAFFCMRSYNHIPGESSACTRCLGCNWSRAIEHSCRPFVFSDRDALPILDFLKDLVSSKKVGLLAQNHSQADLAREHFGDESKINVLGMWTEDVAESMGENIAVVNSTGYDVVFHGAPIRAKGFEWALDMALACPDLEFLFPFSSDNVVEYMGKKPGNVTCKEISWDTGLKEQVAAARTVLVPSLWSAPVEGALAKSIVYGRSVAVVDENTAFSSELPDDLVVKLPSDTGRASKILRDCVKGDGNSTRDFSKKWCEEFSDRNAFIFKRIIESISN